MAGWFSLAKFPFLAANNSRESPWGPSWINSITDDVTGGLDSMPTTLPVAEPETFTEQVTKLAPRYNVILFDDDTHSYAYVVEMMMVLFGMSAKEGFNVAYEVDNIGQAVVKTCPFEEAKEAHAKIKNYGPDFRMASSTGSMASTIEPADE